MGDIPGWRVHFSRDDFDRNATALISAFASSETTTEFEPPFDLCDWRLLSHGRDGKNSSYLSHPPVTVSSGVSSIGNEEARAMILTRQESDGNLEDEGIIADDQCYLDKANANDKGELQQQFVTQWTFSIIYSTTYQTPVLYFHAQELSGSPVGRQQLLKILRHQHQRSAYELSNDSPSDPWDFVSQEEHPVTGLSSFFLHPCQSAQRLQLLTAVAKDQRKICTGLEQKYSFDDSTINVLWVWMSMILPAVGHSVPSSYFRHVQKCIAQQP